MRWRFNHANRTNLPRRRQVQRQPTSSRQNLEINPLAPLVVEPWIYAPESCDHRITCWRCSSTPAIFGARAQMGLRFVEAPRMRARDNDKRS